EDGDHPDAALPRVLDRKLSAQPPRDGVQLARRLRRRGLPGESTGADDEVHRIARAAPRIAIGGERHHDLDVADGRGKAGRQHSDDGIRLAVEPDLTSDDGGIAPESPGPEFMREDDDAIRPAPFVVGLQQTAEARLRTQDVEEIPRGANALYALRLALVAQVRAEGEESGEAREAPRAITVVDEVRHVERRAIAARLIGPDPEDALDVAIRQLPQQDAIHDAEDGGRRANRQCNGDDRADRERRRLPKDADGVSDVTNEARREDAHGEAFMRSGRRPGRGSVRSGAGD